MRARLLARASGVLGMGFSFVERRRTARGRAPRGVDVVGLAFVARRCARARQRLSASVRVMAQARASRFLFAYQGPSTRSNGSPPRRCAILARALSFGAGAAIQ